MKEQYISDAVYRKRFMDEGTLIDRLNHPHIVRIYERGEHNNNLFIAMELLVGKTLDREIETKKPISPAVSLDIMQQVIEALVEIHRAGIVHRDLKPANIMLVQKGDKENFVKILDFGLAKTQTVSRVTESGMVVGTLNYLSPEQLLDSQYSSASDIYALGIMFYEMMTGKKPYSGETALEILQSIFKGQLSEPRTLNKDIPDKLNDLPLRMIAKEPEKRPFAEELRITLQKLR